MVEVARVRAGDTQHDTDAVAAEEPLEIRLHDTALAVVMRTPGHDEDLVRGFLLSEGMLLKPGEAADIDVSEEGRAIVRLEAGIEIDPSRFQRNLFMSSSCGVCGKASIEAVELFAPPAKPFTIGRDAVARLTDTLRVRQPTFDETGGLHAAGLFTLEGDPMTVREDVGRHNAVDKAIGATSLRRWPLHPCVLVVSGRQSFEIVQKAAVVGIGGVIGVSAPSSLAVDLAQSHDMLLVGFARDGDFNVYSGEHHVA